MVRWKKLLRCVGKALCAEGIQALAQEVPFGGFVFNVAKGAWKNWHEDEQDDALRDALNEAAAVPAAQAQAEADAVAGEVAAGQPDAVRQKIAGYLAQLPAHIQRSIRLHGDPTGSTLPATVRMSEAADLLPFLPPSLPQFRPGDALPGRDPWWLVRPLGAGGFGEVWLAQMGTFTKRLMAVKFCHDAAARERLLRHEAELAHHAERPGVVRLLDLNLKAATPWIGFEYVDGSDLAGAIVAWQIVPVPQRINRARAALRRLSETLGRLHADRIVHRDVKPSNVLLREGEPLLTDLGLGAVAASHSLAADRSGQVSRGERVVSYLRGAHTPLYASPQQKAGSKPDPRDDVHALGVTAYQMLTAQVGSGIEPGFDDDLSDLGVPSELIALIQACVHKNPDRRPQDGNGLLARLSPAAAMPVGQQVRTDTPPPEMRQEPARPTAAPAVVKREPARLQPGTSADQVRGLQQKWAEYLGQPVTRRIDLGRGVSLDLNLVPPGAFRMGSTEAEIERIFKEYPDVQREWFTAELPQRAVEITRPFWLGVSPVTVGQFRAFASAAKFKTEAETGGGAYRWTGSEWKLDPKTNWQNPGFTQGDDHPVVCLSWNDTGPLLKWLAKHGPFARPTEAQWEYACRAGTTTAFHFGGALDGTQANCDGNYPFGTAKKGPYKAATTPVGSYKPNALGLLDLHGNAWEWCEDFYGSYENIAAAKDPIQSVKQESDRRVLRGGSWDDDARYCRAAFRNGDAPGDRNYDFGFRVCLPWTDI